MKISASHVSDAARIIDVEFEIVQVRVPQSDDLGGPQWLSYSQFVADLLKPLPYKENLNHLALGIAGEAGEFVDAIKRHTIYENPLDKANVIEELGDLLFFITGTMNALNLTLDEVLQANAEKLAKRYEKLQYSNQAAVAREDKK